jgi:hypothetical protein
MTGERIELLLEFGVILLSPIIHTYYLWKFKKADISVVRQNIKIFSVMYALLAVGAGVLFLKHSAL